MSFPKKYQAIKVSQPFGDFFVISMVAADLLKVSFSDALRYEKDSTLVGSQRPLDLKNRVREISRYIDGFDTAFPNSIIVSANITPEGFIEDDFKKKWWFEETVEGVVLNIPSSAKLAAIIDGQHRLNGFENASVERREGMELLVAIYFDLPTPYQAYLFATINYNQRPVNKSLALEQFGYLTELTDSRGWSPELLAVYLAKKLNIDQDSPFYNHIKVAPQNDHYLLEHNPKEMKWIVSTATIVDGILKLITTNPKKDANQLRLKPEKSRMRELLEPNIKAPLRKFYLESNDIFIYRVVINYFNALNEIIFNISKTESYINKTVGIQALFGVLRELLLMNLSDHKDISKTYFSDYIQKFKHIDFTDNFFTASGIGKSRIQNAILLCLKLKDFNSIRDSDQSDYNRLLGWDIQLRS